MPRSNRTFAVAVLAAAMTACTAGEKPSKVETALANMAKDVAIPMEAEKLTNPLQPTDDVIGQGRGAYTASCAVCHGTDGRGNTQLGRNLYPPAMDLNSPHVQHWKDAELFWIIQNGVRLTGMPSWKSGLSEKDTWAVVTFLRDLPKENAAGGAGQAPAAALAAANAASVADLVIEGRTLYRQEGCFTCHQLDGEGTKVGPDLSLEGTRGRSDAWLAGHFKEPAKYSPGSMMPPFVNLSDQQLQALTAFLQHQKGSPPK